MKKLLSFLTAGVLCGSLLAALPVSAAETATRKTGDITGDGIVDLDDCCIILQYYANAILKQGDAFLSKYPSTFDFSLEIADINKDGVIDTSDAILIQKFFTKDIIGLAPDTIEEMMAAYKK